LNRLPFGRPGRFYRGNLHTHSTRSDGARSPADVVAIYRDAGYDFISLTDHFLDRYGYPIVDTREFRSDRFTTLLGAELHGPRVEVGETWHIVAVGLPLEFARPVADETGPAIAARAAAAGAFVGMAHPAWYSLTLNDATALEACDAVEVWNQVAAIDNDRGDSWYMSDMLSSRGRRLLAYAADDAHFRNGRDDRKAWVHVRATSVEPDVLLAALKAGHFYSSQGPLIQDVSIEGRTLRVKCSPADAVFATGRGPLTQPIWGMGLTDATFTLDRFAGSYVRVTVVDAGGKRAWTNPIWLDSAS
jgi:predicted metal-dependent phosphoesterase TrpH